MRTIKLLIGLLLISTALQAQSKEWYYTLDISKIHGIDTTIFCNPSKPLSTITWGKIYSVEIEYKTCNGTTTQFAILGSNSEGGFNMLPSFPFVVSHGDSIRVNGPILNYQWRHAWYDTKFPFAFAGFYLLKGNATKGFITIIFKME